MWRHGLRLVTAAGLLLAAGCQGRLGETLKGLVGSVERPTVKAVRPRITGLDLDSVALAFDIDIDNPYGVPIKSPRFRYGVDIQGEPFLQEQQATGLDLPAKGVGTVTLPVRLTYASLWSAYRKLEGATEVPYRLHGAVAVSALGTSLELPVSKSGTFPVLKRPEFSNIEVQIGEVSLRGAQVTVDADIRNPNAFALGLEKLGYALKLGEVGVGNLVASTDKSIGAGQSGRVRLTGEVSGTSALGKLLRGGSLGAPKLSPSGALQTPYGTASIRED